MKNAIAITDQVIREDLISFLRKVSFFGASGSVSFSQNDLFFSRTFELYIVVDDEFIVVGNYSNGVLIESGNFVWHSNANERTPWKFCYVAIIFSLLFFHF
jgi:hypothetical protein